MPIDKTHTAGRGNRSDLLRDLTGEGFEYVAAKAAEIVLHGPNQALEAVPKARYGKYLTADREEIERINAIHKLFRTYVESPRDNKPLSIAVFGPPGSGKSFAIKQLASTVLENSVALTFNLSQLRTENDLQEAFHSVHDQTIQGRIPLVFWDEFDVNDLKWLKEFLAPMQDAEFNEGSVTHPLGKSIFIFAGGTCSCFDEFNRSEHKGKEGGDFRNAKGPDFISRWRGFVNIKGANPLPPLSHHNNTAGNAEETKVSYMDLALHDLAHLVRRAIILRVALERYHPDIIDPDTKAAAISAAVVNAFLRVEKYLHGARSLDSIVSMSRVVHTRYLSVADCRARICCSCMLHRISMTILRKVSWRRP